MSIFMPNQPTDLIQGTLEMLVLKTLALEPLHGYGIALRIEQISDGAFRVNPGSLLPPPPLHTPAPAPPRAPPPPLPPAPPRRAPPSHVKGEWRATENNRRAKYY